MKLSQLLLFTVCFGFIVLMLPANSWSCPVCFSAASKKVLHNYYLSAAFLTLLPFSVVAVISTVLYRFHKKNFQAQNSDDPARES